MVDKTRLLALTVFCISGMLTVNAQNAPITAGGEAVGAGHSVSYSVGQIVYTTYSMGNYSLAEGVNQPLEISMINAIEGTEDIELSAKVYPNPTRSWLILKTGRSEFTELKYHIFDLNGRIIMKGRVGNSATEIVIDHLPSSTYILRIMSGETDIKTFKIIKN